MTAYFIERVTTRTGEQETYIRNPEIGIIPCDPLNRHYQEYLAWVAEGNTAEEWTGE